MFLFQKSKIQLLGRQRLEDNEFEASLGKVSEILTQKQIQTKV
jgi:hypothetical protein